MGCVKRWTSPSLTSLKSQMTSTLITTICQMMISRSFWKAWPDLRTSSASLTLITTSGWSHCNPWWQSSWNKKRRLHSVPCTYATVRWQPRWPGTCSLLWTWQRIQFAAWALLTQIWISLTSRNWCILLRVRARSKSLTSVGMVCGATRCTSSLMSL